MKEIHKSKLPANMVMVTDANGYPSASSLITASELNTLNNYDAKGYIFTRLGTLESNTVKTSSSWGMPNYAERVSLEVGTVVVPVDSIGYARSCHDQNSDVTVTVDGAVVFWVASGSSSSTSAGGQFLIPAGSTVTISGDLQEAYYAPLKKS